MGSPRVDRRARVTRHTRPLASVTLLACLGLAGCGAAPATAGWTPTAAACARTRPALDQVSTGGKQLRVGWTEAKVPIGRCDFGAGPFDAPSSAVVFLDHHCPGCVGSYFRFRRLMQRHAGKPIRFVAKLAPAGQRCNPYTPNDDPHDYGCEAALAVRCAGRQGRFWQMSDRLYRHQDRLDISNLHGHAAAVGLDSARFTACLASPDTLRSVRADARLAHKAGVKETPTAYLDGKLIDLYDQYSVLETAVEKVLAAKRATGGKGNKDEKTPAAKPVWGHRLHPEDPVLGPADAPVRVVVMSGFGCKGCASLAPDLRRIQKEHPKDVQIRFQHKILEPQHDHAVLAALGAACAGRQGRFWPVHDALMGVGAALSPAGVAAAAKKAGIDMKRWQACVDKRETWPLLTRGTVVANETGSHSMPNVLVNGVRVARPRNYASVKAEVARQLATAKRLMATGVRRADVYRSRTGSGKRFAQFYGPRAAIPTEGSFRLGSASATHEVVVFIDLQCPYSARLAPLLEALVTQRPKDFSVVIKHFPIQGHNHAPLAAEAAVEAQLQGRFWPFVRRLFAHPKQLDKGSLLAHAKAVGMDVARLQRALQTGQHEALVDRDARHGDHVGLSGTPSVHVDGFLYGGPRGYPVAGLDGVARLIAELRPRRAAGRKAQSGRAP